MRHTAVTTDLIYKGIMTVQPHRFFVPLRGPVTTDLIYKGIMTQ